MMVAEMAEKMAAKMAEKKVSQSVAMMADLSAFELVAESVNAMVA